MFVECVISQSWLLGVSAWLMALGSRKSGCDPLPIGELIANRSLMHGANDPYATDRYRYCGRSFLAGLKGGSGNTIHAGGALA